MEIDISVRGLVEFVFRKGDIDAAFMSMRRALEGTNAHVKFQRLRKQQARLENFTYQSELVLQHSFIHKDFRFNIDGRADGIMIKDGEIFIEEIKSTYMDLEYLEVDEDYFHLAQAKSYAFIYTDIYEIKNIKVLLTYYNIEYDNYKIFEYSFEYEELRNFFYDALDKYYVFAKLNLEFKEERNKTGELLEFPYPEYRKGQRQLAVAVYKTIDLNKKLFVQAPTGIGKTISTLFPSIKALVKQKADKIFYLTAKTPTRRVAEDAFELMLECGLKIKSVTLTAKEKICLNSETQCSPDFCEYAKGHFDRLNNALLDILQNEYLMKRNVIESYAEKHKVCPFEFAFDIINFCDCVICDYNYVYDPKVYLKNFFAEGMKNNFILLNDESHNLVDRARNMFSADLDYNIFHKLHKSLSKGPLKKSVLKLKDCIKDIEYTHLAASENCVFEKLNSDFNYLLYNFVRDADIFLKENKSDSRNNDVLDVFFKALDFLRISEFFDSHFIFYIYREKSNIFLKILCLDPSDMLSGILKRVTSSIFFSATLSPIFYFKKVLGSDEDDFDLIIDSPYDKNNFKLIIDAGISTKYVHRENSYLKIADRLNTFINAKKGNYFVFFPSYSYMYKVYELFCFKYSEKNTIIQERDLSDTQREEFLNNFYAGNEVLAFAVLGGVFSEGIDLMGDRLIGACIVSVGLPLVSTERNIISDYYKKTEGDGFNFAYKFPGINKVLQAAGRVIRSETDKGAVLLIDDRFTNYDYKILYPRNWSNHDIINNPTKLYESLHRFWYGAE